MAELDKLKDSISQAGKASIELTKKTQEILNNTSSKKIDFINQLRICEKSKNNISDLYKQILKQYSVAIEKNESSQNLMSLYTYVEGARVHINIQQDDCNQLRYEIQQCQYNRSMNWAYIAVFFTILFSTISITLTLCPNLLKKFSIGNNPPKIEYVMDSIKILNARIEQQNDIIEKYFTLQANDSVINPDDKKINPDDGGKKDR